MSEPTDSTPGPEVSPVAPEPPGSPASPIPDQSPPPALTEGSPGGGEQAAPDVPGKRPTFVFFGIVAGISLLLDVSSKAWAEVYFNKNLLGHTVQLVEGHLALVLAYNKGGAWGLGHGWSDTLRLPFFLFVSVAAIAFIVSLYARLMPRQTALQWGLPLVLGGALGNLTDRIVRNQVIDFIDYRGDWVEKMNELVAQTVAPGWSITDHWPTFNVADVAICFGVGLMAVDMLTSRRAQPPQATAPPERESLPTESDPSEVDRAVEAAPPAPQAEPALQVPESASPVPVTEATDRS